MKIDLNNLREFVGRGAAAQKAVDELLDGERTRLLSAARQTLAWAEASGCVGCDCCDQAREIVQEADR